MRERDLTSKGELKRAFVREAKKKERGGRGAGGPSISIFPHCREPPVTLPVLDQKSTKFRKKPSLQVAGQLREYKLPGALLWAQYGSARPSDVCTHTNPAKVLQGDPAERRTSSTRSERVCYPPRAGHRARLQPNCPGPNFSGRSCSIGARSASFPRQLTLSMLISRNWDVGRDCRFSSAPTPPRQLGFWSRHPWPLEKWAAQMQVAIISNRYLNCVI